MLEMEQIEARRRIIRLSVDDLAKAAGCNSNTAGPALSGKRDPRHGTALALEAALIADELRLRDYLLALHPLAPATTAGPGPIAQPLPSENNGIAE